VVVVSRRAVKNAWGFFVGMVVVRLMGLVMIPSKNSVSSLVDMIALWGEGRSDQIKGTGSGKEYLPVLLLI
jgi:hypothetical protein